jgi:hypothetical protein
MIAAWTAMVASRPTTSGGIVASGEPSGLEARAHGPRRESYTAVVRPVKPLDTCREPEQLPTTQVTTDELLVHGRQGRSRLGGYSDAITHRLLVVILAGHAIIVPGITISSAHCVMAQMAYTLNPIKLFGFLVS